MYKYKDLILPYIEGEYKISEKGELTCLCPFITKNIQVLE